MQKMFLPTITFFLVISLQAQSEEDYTKTLNLVQKAFNEKNATLIYQQFNSALKANLSEQNLKQNFDKLHSEKGVISSFDIILDEETEKNYLVEFENASMLLVILMSSDNQISLFEIKEY